MYAGLFTRGAAAGAVGATTQPFLSATQSQALAMVMDAVARRAPVALLTGEAGVGKTALLNEMAATLFGTPVQIIKVTHPLPRPLELQKLIAAPLGLPDAETLTPTEVARALASLAGGADPERRILLLADDAHLLPQETLRYLGLMAELLGGRQALLQIVLSGRPALLEVLRHPDLAPLLRRVDLHAVIESLTSRETRDYLDHRLGLAGLSVKACLTQPALSDVRSTPSSAGCCASGWAGAAGGSPAACCRRTR
jgi:type II secretory pathway predicted ATPase ExeA